MVDAARANDWDRLTRLEKQVASLRDRIGVEVLAFPSRPDVACPEDERRQIALIRRILDDDKEVRVHRAVDGQRPPDALRAACGERNLRRGTPTTRPTATLIQCRRADEAVMIPGDLAARFRMLTRPVSFRANHRRPWRRSPCPGIRDHPTPGQRIVARLQPPAPAPSSPGSPAKSPWPAPVKAGDTLELVVSHVAPGRCSPPRPADTPTPQRRQPPGPQPGRAPDQLSPHPVSHPPQEPLASVANPWSSPPTAGTGAACSPPDSAAGHPERAVLQNPTRPAGSPGRSDTAGLKRAPGRGQPRPRFGRDPQHQQRHRPTPPAAATSRPAADSPSPSRTPAAAGPSATRRHRHPAHGVAGPGVARADDGMGDRDPERDRAAAEDGAEAYWNTTLRLTLPGLGGVEARLHLTPAGVAMRLITDSADTTRDATRRRTAAPG